MTFDCIKVTNGQSNLKRKKTGSMLLVFLFKLNPIYGKSYINAVNSHLNGLMWQEGCPELGKIKISVSLMIFCR